MTEDRRDPVASDFGEHDLEIGVAVERATQHQLPHRPARLDVGEELLARDGTLLRRFVMGEHHVEVVRAGGFDDIVVRLAEHLERHALLPAIARVHHQRKATFDRTREVGIPVAVVEWRHGRMARVAGRERADEPVVRHPVEVGQRLVHVDARARSRRPARTDRSRTPKVSKTNRFHPRAPAAQASSGYRSLWMLWNMSPSRKSPRYMSSAAMPSRSISARRIVGVVQATVSGPLVALGVLGLGHQPFDEEPDRRRVDLVVLAELREELVVLLREILRPELVAELPHASRSIRRPSDRSSSPSLPLSKRSARSARGSQPPHSGSVPWPMRSTPVVVGDEPLRRVEGHHVARMPARSSPPR